MPLPLMFTPLPMIQTYINLPPSSVSLPLMLALNFGLAISSTINSDLQSISEWGTRNLVKFNTSKTQLLTISLSNNPSNYPIIFEDSEIPPLNSVNILGLQISSSLSWRDHIVQIAKSASKKLGVLFRCKLYFNSAQLFKLYTGFIRPCLEYCSHIWGSSPYTSLLDRVESKAIRLISDPSLTSTLDLCLFAARWLHFLFSTAITLVTALMNWLPVFHLQWLGHVPHVRQHLPTTIVWNSPMRELIGSVMVSSPLLLTFGTLSLLLYFRLPSTFLPSKGRSITTLGTRWHDVFSLLFLDILQLFYSLHYTSFPFLKGYRLEKGHMCARSVFPFIKKKKKSLESRWVVYIPENGYHFPYPPSFKGVGVGKVDFF